MVAVQYHLVDMCFSSQNTTTPNTPNMLREFLKKIKTSNVIIQHITLCRISKYGPNAKWFKCLTGTLFSVSFSKPVNGSTMAQWQWTWLIIPAYLCLANLWAETTTVNWWKKHYYLESSENLLNVEFPRNILEWICYIQKWICKKNYKAMNIHRLITKHMCTLLHFVHFTFTLQKV